MKNFNIILIACLAFLFLSSSGCSKEEEEKESPYKREQIIGRWYHQSYYIEDKYGNGKWVDKPNFGETYNQYNADGTYYTQNIQLSKNTWALKGKDIVTKFHRDDDSFYIEQYEIEELTQRTLILNTKRGYPNNSKIKYINGKYM